VNINVRSYYAQGSKTLAFETAEQLGWRLPDQVVAPIASGSLYTKLAKGFDELVGVGLVDGPTPRLWGAQAEGCSPVATAWAAGADAVVPVRPDTIAKSLAIGAPADGGNALAVARRTDGGIAAVSDDDVVEAIGPAGPDDGHLHRDGGRRDGRHARPTGSRGAARPARDRPWPSSPATV
jgi:threonine synthase